MDGEEDVWDPLHMRPWLPQNRRHRQPVICFKLLPMLVSFHDICHSSKATMANSVETISIWISGYSKTFFLSIWVWVDEIKDEHIKIYNNLGDAVSLVQQRHVSQLATIWIILIQMLKGRHCGWDDALEYFWSKAVLKSNKTRAATFPASVLNLKSFCKTVLVLFWTKTWFKLFCWDNFYVVWQQLSWGYYIVHIWKSKTCSAIGIFTYIYIVRKARLGCM